MEVWRALLGFGASVGFEALHYELALSIDVVLRLKLHDWGFKV